MNNREMLYRQAEQAMENASYMRSRLMALKDARENISKEAKRRCDEIKAEEKAIQTQLEKWEKESATLKAAYDELMKQRAAENAERIKKREAEAAASMARVQKELDDGRAAAIAARAKAKVPPSPEKPPAEEVKP